MLQRIHLNLDDFNLVLNACPTTKDDSAEKDNQPSLLPFFDQHLSDIAKSSRDDETMQRILSMIKVGFLSLSTKQF